MGKRKRLGLKSIELGMGGREVKEGVDGNIRGNMRWSVWEGERKEINKIRREGERYGGCNKGGEAGKHRWLRGEEERIQEMEP